MMRIDPSWLVHEIEYMKRIGTDDYGKVLYGVASPVKNVRYDYKPTFNRTATQVELIGNAVVYVYADYTDTDISAFKVDDKLIFEGQEHTVKEVKRYAGITSAKLFSVELVVV